MKVTVDQLLEAAKKNGFIHSRGYWFMDEVRDSHDSDGSVVGEPECPIIEACFLGQVAINLGVEGSALHSALNEHFMGLGSDIISWNDDSYLPYNEIYERVAARIKNSKLVLNLSEAKYYAKRMDENVEVS